MIKINSSPNRLKSLLAAAAVIVVSVAGQVIAAPIQQNNFFRDNSVLVYGSQNKDTAKGEAMVAFNLKKQMKSYINMSADKSLNQSSLSSGNLVILSTGNSNNILILKGHLFFLHSGLLFLCLHSYPSDPATEKRSTLPANKGVAV